MYYAIVRISDYATAHVGPWLGAAARAWIGDTCHGKGETAKQAEQSARGAAWKIKQDRGDVCGPPLCNCSECGEPCSPGQVAGHIHGRPICHTCAKPLHIPPARMHYRAGELASFADAARAIEERGE